MWLEPLYLILRNFGGKKLWRITSNSPNFLPIFTAFIIEFAWLHIIYSKTYVLLFMVVYFPLAYHYRAFSTVASYYQMYFYNEITITSNLKFVVVQLFRDSPIIAHKFSYTITPCTGYRLWLLSACKSS